MSDAEDTAGSDEKSGGKFKKLALLTGLFGGLAMFFKRKREAELDEALWDEPDNDA